MITQRSFPTVLKHSRKPHIFRDKIVELFGKDKKRIELFARERNELFNEYEGWDVWGNEIKSDIDLSEVLCP